MSTPRRDNRRADPRAVANRVQELIEQIEGLPDPAARALLQECVQSLLALYGDGLARIIEHLKESDNDGKPAIEPLLADPAISGLLLIHGLHPVPLEDRLQAALDSVRPYMHGHGGGIQLVSLENDVARVRLEGTCKGCPSSTITLELAVRKAVEDACPDLAGFEVESIEEQSS